MLVSEPEIKQCDSSTPFVCHPMHGTYTEGIYVALMEEKLLPISSHNFNLKCIQSLCFSVSEYSLQTSVDLYIKSGHGVTSYRQAAIMTCLKASRLFFFLSSFSFLSSAIAIAEDMSVDISKF